MWPDSSGLIIISALVLLVRPLPLNIDSSTSQYPDPDSIAQNEKFLKLFLQLAVHTADRLMRLRNEIDNDHDCNKRNDNLPLSTTEVIITQLSSQADQERLDKEQEIQNRLFFNNSQINNSNQISLENLDHGQTAFLYSTQSQQLFNPYDLQKSVSDQNFAHNLDIKANNLIPKSMQEVPSMPSDFSKYNHKVFNPVTLQKPISDLNTGSNSLNINKFNPNERNSQNAPIDGISERLFNPIKNTSNAKIINDLTETVNNFLPRSQNLQESTLGMSQRLYGTDLVKGVPGIKIMSDLHENQQNQQISCPLNVQESSNKNGDVSKRFFDSGTIKNFGNVLSPQVVNLPVNQILPNTENIVKSIIKALPEKESVKSASNLFNQITTPQSQITNAPFKNNENREYLADFNSAKHHQIRETTTQAEDQTNNLMSNQNLVSYSGNVEANVPEGGTQKKYNNMPVNVDNSKTQNSDQSIFTSPINQKNSSVPLLRLLPDEHKKAESDFSSIQINESINNSTNEKLSVKNHQVIDQHLDQINEEIKSEGFEKMSEMKTDYKNEQLNPSLEDLSEKNGKKGLNNAAIEILTSSNRLEFDTSTISSIMKYEDKSSNGVQESGNVNIVAKSNPGNNLLSNKNVNRSNGKQNAHVDSYLSKLNSFSRFIDDSKDENLHEQLSEIKLQEMSERLINALRLIIEKEMANSRNHMTIADQTKIHRI